MGARSDGLMVKRRGMRDWLGGIGAVENATSGLPTPRGGSRARPRYRGQINREADAARRSGKDGVRA